MISSTSKSSQEIALSSGEYDSNTEAFSPFLQRTHSNDLEMTVRLLPPVTSQKSALSIKKKLFQASDRKVPMDAQAGGYPGHLKNNHCFSNNKDVPKAEEPLQETTDNGSTPTNANQKQNNIFLIKTKSQNQVKITKFNKIKALSPLSILEGGDPCTTFEAKITAKTPTRNLIADQSEGSNDRNSITIEKNVPPQTLALRKIMPPKVQLRLERKLTEEEKLEVHSRRKSGLVTLTPTYDRPPLAQVAQVVSCQNVKGFDKFTFDPKEFINSTFINEKDAPQREIKPVKTERVFSAQTARRVAGENLRILPHPVKIERKVMRLKREPSLKMEPDTGNESNKAKVSKRNFADDAVASLLEDTTTQGDESVMEAPSLLKVRHCHSEQEAKPVAVKKNSIRFRNQETILNKIFRCTPKSVNEL